MGDLNIEVKLDINTKALKNAAAEQIQAALEEIGMKAENHAKLICPVDTGLLRNSITHTQEDKTAIIGSNVEYAPYVELGTSKRAATPFLTPAIQDNVGEYKAILEKHLKSG